MDSVDAVWRIVPGCPGYRVSNDGRVQSHHYKEWRTLKQTKNSRGYFVVGLYSESGKHRVICVHQIVALAFIGERPSNLQTRHLDGNKENNHISNLKYGTAKENCDDKDRHGTMNRGETHGMHKLTESQVIEIRCRVNAGELHRDIAADYGIDKTLISHIACGRNWENIGPQCKTQPKCKINEDIVRDIRSKAASGISQGELQAEYGLSAGSICMIISGKRWGHVR